MNVFRLATFGCKVNQYETQVVREMLSGGGWREAAEGEPAELCVVNTCTVTARADQKCRQAIRRLARENPGAEVVVIGCYARREPDRIQDIEGVGRVVRTVEELPELLAGLGADIALKGIASLEGHHRAFLKVQDGCVMNCSYCIIPTVRPVLSSRPIGDVVQEVRRLSEAGYREIVLCGIHLGHYGRDLDDRPTLADLVRRLSRMPEPFRIRLSSMEAGEVTDELLDAMAEGTKVCPHLHLSLQSGSARVLERMRRPYGPEAFLRQVDRVRDRLDAPALTTDVIVGFPGEMETDFEATCEVARSAGFSRIHVFSFSPRPGTSAAELPDRVSPQVVKDRKERLSELAMAMATQYYLSLVGRRLETLVETAVDGQLDGMACRYVPVRLSGPGEWLGELIPVVGEAVADGRLRVRHDGEQAPGQRRTSP